MSDLLAAASRHGCRACASNVKRHDLSGLTHRMRHVRSTRSTQLTGSDEDGCSVTA
jgi:hypothetical protein